VVQFSSPPPLAGGGRRRGYRRASFEFGVAPLHQLDAIAERVIDIDTVLALERFVFIHIEAGRFQCRQILDEKTRMRLARRRKILVDTEMDLERVMHLLSPPRKRGPNVVPHSEQSEFAGWMGPRFRGGD
jgi:hypothetical protein